MSVIDIDVSKVKSIVSIIQSFRVIIAKTFNISRTATIYCKEVSTHLLAHVIVALD